jgi:hypothetical protein
VTAPSRRLTARIAADFSPAEKDAVIGWLTGFGPDVYGGQDVERIQAAMVLGAAGEWNRFMAMVRLLRIDWRDLLVCGRLENADWAERLTAELGP